MGTWWAAGCPEGLSVRAWAVALPAWLLTWAALASVVPGSDIVLWILVGLSGFLLTGIAMLVGAISVNCVRGPHRTVGTVVVWVVAGVLGLVMSMLVGAVTELRPDRSSALSFLAAACFTCVWFPVGGRFASSVKADLKARSQLLGQLARERALALESAQLVEADRRRLVNQTEQVVVEQLSKATALSADPVAAAAALRAVVDEVVRPLSHELGRDDVQEQALVESVHTMGQVAARPLTAFLGELRRPGTTMALSTIGRIVVSVAVVIGLNGWGPVPASTLIVLAVLAGYTLVASALVVLATARSDESERELLLAVEAAEWASSRLRQLAWSERERLGRSIHGDAQAQIVATALQIQLGQHHDIDGQVKALEHSIHDLLETDERTRDWRATLKRILKVWDYSVTVSVRIDDAAASRLDADPIAAHALVSVVREAVTNAVRHGQARSIDIVVELERDDLVHLDVIDDGTDQHEPRPPGIGSRTMTAACHEWHLNNTTSGHCLLAWIPTSGGVAHG